MAPERKSSALVCLSGGVDSTAALLRCTQQFTLTRAVFVKTSSLTAPEQARESCRKLGVELLIAEAEDLFNKEIKEYTRRIYSLGLTPNPCALCNAKVKLAVPFSMLEPDEVLVTGHYAQHLGGILKKGSDPSKDQSYFLSLVSSRILDRCFFPLALSLKAEVRKEVLDEDIPFIESESQDLCFQRDTGGLAGDILNTCGEIVGRHNGLDGYTPGQRKGLGAHSSRQFVIRLDYINNNLIIGDEENLYSETCNLNSINWLKRPEKNRFVCRVQTRYRKPASDADVILNKDGCSARIKFHSPEKAVSPGQIGAMFDGDAVLGGGIISRYEGDKNV